MGGRKARLFVQIVDAVLVVIVVSAGDAVFAKFYKKLLELVNLTSLGMILPRHPKPGKFELDGNLSS